MTQFKLNLKSNGHDLTFINSHIDNIQKSYDVTIGEIKNNWGFLKAKLERYDQDLHSEIYEGIHLRLKTDLEKFTVVFLE